MTGATIKTAEDWIDQIEEFAAYSIRSRIRWDIARFLDRSESPIERVLGAAFIQGENYRAPRPGETHAAFHASPFTWGRDGLGSLAPEWKCLARHYFVQAEVFGYRADFLLVVRVGNQERAVVIECDGHDFHERTKEQARHDRARDRWMQTGGVVVLRFTGSEIWANPFLCADEVTNFAAQLEDELLSEYGKGDE